MDLLEIVSFLTPLIPLQARILALIGLPTTIYSDLAYATSSIPP